MQHPHVYEVFSELRVTNHGVFDGFRYYFLGCAQRAPKIDFGRPLGVSGAPLSSPFLHVGGAVGLLRQRLGANGSQKHQDESVKSDFGSS